MKALTLTQPWATAIATGVKAIETRSWRTHYRGPLAIHAAKGFPRKAREFATFEFTIGRIPKRLALGAVIAVATLVDIVPAEEVVYEISAIERLYGDYTAGRWAWKFADVHELDEPVPALGHPGLWNWEGAR